VVGSGADVTGGGGGGGGGVGSDVACVGLGTPFDGGGCSGCPLPSPLPVALADGFAPAEADADGDTDPEADSPGLAEAPPFPPVLPWVPTPPPPSTDPPPGARPPCRPAECAGPGRPASSPTLIQPAADATTMTVAARRTGTYKARTGSHLRMGSPLLGEAESLGTDRGVPLSNSRRPQEDTREHDTRPSSKKRQTPAARSPVRPPPTHP
jgi:hypothetical protein